MTKERGALSPRVVCFCPRRVPPQACSYPKSMWRCYDAAFFGGVAAEGTAGDQLYDAGGGAVFTRAWIAGLPWAANADGSDGEPLAVCTPSLRNGASAAAALSAAAAAAAVLFALLTLN